MKRQKIAYHIIRRGPSSVLIEDLSAQVGGMSVTNAAEQVIEDLLSKKLIDASIRVFYTDTMGQIDELCHDGRRFTRFAPGT